MSMFSKIKAIKDLRDQAKTLQNALATHSASGEAQGGRIKVNMNGNQEVVSIEIADELFTPDNKKRVTEGVTEATNKAIKNVQKIMAEEMKKMGGLDFNKMLGQDK